MASSSSGSNGINLGWIVLLCVGVLSLGYQCSGEWKYEVKEIATLDPMRSNRYLASVVRDTRISDSRPWHRSDGYVDSVMLEIATRKVIRVLIRQVYSSSIVSQVNREAERSVTAASLWLRVQSGVL